MKNILVLCLTLFNLCSAYSQLVVVDPGDIAATIANGGILVKTNEIIKDANTIANNIKTTVQDIHHLQQNIDDALWEVRSIISQDNLGISNIDFELEANAKISAELDMYLEGLVSSDHPLVRAYANTEVQLGSSDLHQSLSFDFEESIPSELYTIQHKVGEKTLNRELFAYASARKQIQIALTYNQLADVMLAKAEQLNSLLHESRSISNDEAVLKMNEADRIQLLETSASYVRKALELRLSCDQLIQQEIEREAPKQKEALKMYQQYAVMEQFFSNK